MFGIIKVLSTGMGEAASDRLLGPVVLHKPPQGKLTRRDRRRFLAEVYTSVDGVRHWL